MGYRNLYWVGSVSDWKTTSRSFFSLESAVIAWLSRKQTSVVLTIVEGVYIVTCLTYCEAMWLWKLLLDLFGLDLDATYIYFDN